MQRIIKPASIGIFALDNIAFEAQPPSLFRVPADYRKLDPQALLERIKHSDVWAAPILQ